MAAEAAYSAGTIFLQVVPVFRRAQRDITAYAQNIGKSLGDDMEREGAKAGERAGKAMGEEMEKEAEKSGGKSADAFGSRFQKTISKHVAEARKEIDGIDFKTASEKSITNLDRVKKKLEELDHASVSPDFNEKKILAGVAAVEAAIKDLTKTDHELAITDNMTEAIRHLRAVGAEADRVVEKKRQLVFDVDDKKVDEGLKNIERRMGFFEKKVRTSAQRAAAALGEAMDPEIKKLRRELESIGDTDITIGINDDIALHKIDDLRDKLIYLAQNSPDIGVRVEAGRALAELEIVQKMASRLDGRTLTMNVDVDSAAAESHLAALSGDGRGSANAFRAFNAVILAAVTLLPALIPIIAALGGALLALGPILAGLGGGLAAVVIGFSGIANAVQALSQQSNKSAKDTATATQQIKAAWYGVVDARQAVQDAERSYSQSAADSARAVADARRQAAEATRAALEQQRQAQEAYASSVRDVRDAEQGLRDARKQAQQDKQDLTDRIKDTKLSIRQGVLNAFDATNNLNAVMADGSSTNYDKEQAKIQRAQALQSLHEQRVELKRLEADQKRQRKEGVNGTDAVKTAQQRLTDAIRAQRDALIRVRDADRNVSKVRIDNARNIANALRQQHRTDEDGRRAVARAQEQLRRAQENYNRALHDTSALGSAADQNVKNAMAALGPAGRQFARFIFGLRKGFYRLRDDIQAVMLPPIERAMKRIIRVDGPAMHDLLVTLGRGFGRFAEALSKSLTGPAWTRFLRTMAKYAPEFNKLFGQAVIKWLETFADLMVIVAPFSLQFARAMTRAADAAAKWMNSKAGVDTVTGFMKYASQVGPDVVKFLERFVGAVINLSVALAPWGEVVLKALDGLLGFIANMNPTVLGLIATALISLAIAFQIATGAVALFAAISAIVLSPVVAVVGGFAISIGLLVAGVTLLVSLIVVLAVRFKIVRQALMLLFKAMIFWPKLLIEINIWVAKWIWHTGILQKAFDVFFGAMKKVWNVALALAADAWAWLAKVAKDAWDNYLEPVITALGKAFGWLWQHVLRPIGQAIIGIFRKIGHVLKAVWDGFLFPVLDLLIHIWLKFGNKVVLPIIRAVIFAFRHMGDYMHTVWTHVIRPILTAFGDAMGWLWKHAVKPRIDFMIDLWHTFATGFKWAYDHTLKPVIDAFIDLLGGPQGIKAKFEWVVGKIKDIWDGLKKILAAPIIFGIDVVLNKGLIGGFNKLANFVGSKPMAEIPLPKALQYSSGGVMPGYFPGGDNHHFFSPTAGRLDLSGGEAIMRPEWTKAVGPGFIDSMNSAAARGGAGAVRKAMFGQAFAKGGILKNPDARVSMDGQNIAAIAAAQILLAERLARRDYQIMQGSMYWGGNAVAASGSSHNYPGVADIRRAGGGITFADQAALRKVGFAAWARNIPGAAYVGSGEHAHSVSLLSPGDAKSPQVYGSWAGHTDGLGGGPDYGPRPGWIAGLSGLLDGFDLSNIDAGGGGKHGFGLPSWVLKIAKNPIGWAAGLVTEPIKGLYDKFSHNGFVDEVAGMGTHLVKAVAHKALGMIPGGAAIAHAAGFAWDKVNDVGHFIGNAASNVGGAISDGAGHLGDVFGFSRGGILPYNGTMMYDAGGYLPPGLTSVVNLTGKPEPVFTADQMEGGAGPGGGGFTYAPTYHDARGTEEIMGDLEFTWRSMGRGTGRGPNGGKR